MALCKTHYVYLIQAGLCHFKVGISKHPKRRLRNMQGGCPLEMTLLSAVGPVPHQFALRFEQAILKAMAPFHSHGEWLDIPDYAIVDALKETMRLWMSWGFDKVIQSEAWKELLANG